MRMRSQCGWDHNADEIHPAIYHQSQVTRTQEQVAKLRWVDKPRKVFIPSNSPIQVYLLIRRLNKRNPPVQQADLSHKKNLSPPCFINRMASNTTWTVSHILCIASHIIMLILAFAAFAAAGIGSFNENSSSGKTIPTVVMPWALFGLVYFPSSLSISLLCDLKILLFLNSLGFAKSTICQILKQHHVSEEILRRLYSSGNGQYWT